MRERRETLPIWYQGSGGMKVCTKNKKKGKQVRTIYYINISYINLDGYGKIKVSLEVRRLEGLPAARNPSPALHLQLWLQLAAAG